MLQDPVARAIDVGYGHVEFTYGRNLTTGDIRTYSFPSQSPSAAGDQLAVTALNKRDTFLVSVMDQAGDTVVQIESALTRSKVDRHSTSRIGGRSQRSGA